MQKDDCIFCKIAKGEIPTNKVYEDDDVIAFDDLEPLMPVHTLVIPKQHVAGLLDADDALLGEIMKRVKRVAAHLKAALPCDGFNILQNNGEAAGQTVKHVHFHIVPRYGMEPIFFENHKGDMDELKALAERIRL